MAPPLSVVADIERKLARERMRQAADGVPELRTSTMTHIVWAPQRWLPQARKVLWGLEERHPARTIFLVPEPGRGAAVSAQATVRDFQLGEGREVLSEVIEVRLRGEAAKHPASIVLPLLVSDLPAFCRWRGEPNWNSPALGELVGVCDRLVVDSVEWSNPPRGYRHLTELFDRIVVSDIAFRRGLPWRLRLAERWPDVRRTERLRIAGPRADALLLAGWMRSRLRREIALSRQEANVITRIVVDGEQVAAPVGDQPSPSDLLSAELDLLVRDQIYEAAVRSAHSWRRATR